MRRLSDIIDKTQKLLGGIALDIYDHALGTNCLLTMKEKAEILNKADHYGPFTFPSEYINGAFGSKSGNDSTG